MTSLAPRYDVFGADPTKWDNSWAKRQSGNGNGNDGQNGNNGNDDNNGGGLLGGVGSIIGGLLPGQQTAR